VLNLWRGGAEWRPRMLPWSGLKAGLYLFTEPELVASGHRVAHDGSSTHLNEKCTRGKATAAFDRAENTVWSIEKSCCVGCYGYCSPHPAFASPDETLAQALNCASRSLTEIACPSLYTLVATRRKLAWPGVKAHRPVAARVIDRYLAATSPYTGRESCISARRAGAEFHGCRRNVFVPNGKC